MPVGLEIRSVIERRWSRDAALTRYGSFNDSHRRKYEWMLRIQRLVPKVPPRILGPALKGMRTEGLARWAFDHYLDICPPALAGEAAPAIEPVAARAPLRR